MQRNLFPKKGLSAILEKEEQKMDYASEIKSDLPQNRVDFRIEMAYNICVGSGGQAAISD